MAEIWGYSFFQHALLGSALASVLCAFVGTYIVTRRMVIVGGGVAHASLGGVGLGAYFGFSPLLGAAGFALLGGFGISWLASRQGARADSAVALWQAFGMALGVVLAFLAPGFMADLPAYLFGDILSVEGGDLWRMGILTLITIVVFSLFMPQIILIAYDSDFARTQGVRVGVFEALMTALIALSIVCCLRLAGIVMVTALLCVPQTTAALFVRTFRSTIALSVLLGAADCLLGLWASCLLGVPCGAAIILCSAAVYFLCRFVRRSRFK